MIGGIRCQHPSAGVGVMVDNNVEGNIVNTSYVSGKNPFVTNSIASSSIYNNNFTIAYEVESGVQGLGIGTRTVIETTTTDKYVGSNINKSSTSGFVTMDFDALFIHLSVNTFNGNATLSPIEYYAQTETKHHKVGQLEDIFLVNMLNLDSKSTLTIGSDNYLIIPCNQKETPQVYDKRRSYGMGIAIKI